MTPYLHPVGVWRGRGPIAGRQWLPISNQHCCIAALHASPSPAGFSLCYCFCVAFKVERMISGFKVLIQHKRRNAKSLSRQDKILVWIGDSKHVQALQALQATQEIDGPFAILLQHAGSRCQQAGLLFNSPAQCTVHHGRERVNATAPHPAFCLKRS